MNTFHFIKISKEPLEARKPCAAMLPSGKCCALLNSSLISGLAPDLQNELVGIGSPCKWEKGEHLFMDGDRVEKFYYLFSGKVREYYFNSSGEEFLRRVVYPNNYISLHNVFNITGSYTYYGEALNPTTAFSWPVAAFMEILYRNPALGLQIAIVLSTIIEHSSRQNCLCRKARSSQKVAGYLLSKQRSCSNDIGCDPDTTECCRRVDLRPISLAAQDVCMARETFSRILISFQKNNIIRNNRGVITILAIDLLKEICGIE